MFGELFIIKMVENGIQIQMMFLREKCIFKK